MPLAMGGQSEHVRRTPVRSRCTRLPSLPCECQHIPPINENRVHRRVRSGTMMKARGRVCGGSEVSSVVPNGMPALALLSHRIEALAHRSDGPAVKKDAGGGTKLPAGPSLLGVVKRYLRG